MKIVIDDTVCFKHHMTLATTLFALALKELDSKHIPLKIAIDNMLAGQILTLGKEADYSLFGLEITDKTSEELNKILIGSGTATEDERLTNLATQMREIFPKGKMLNRETGKPTIYSFRCSVSTVKERLKTFFQRHGDYSDEDILDATRRYVASFNGNYQDWGFRTLKYFIFKDDVKRGPDGSYVDPISPLLEFLENDDDDDTIPEVEDWERYARN